MQKIYYSISKEIFKILPKKDLPFSYYKLNTATNSFTKLTEPNKIILSSQKKEILNLCELGEVFIEDQAFMDCIEFLTPSLEITIKELNGVISDKDMVNLIISGIKSQIDLIFKESFKNNYEEYHVTLQAIGDFLYVKPHLIWEIIPELDTTHSLTNKATLACFLGAAICLFGREIKTDKVLFIDSLFALSLYDIGMINFPDFVLDKKAVFTLEERKRVNLHPVTSLEMVSRTKLLNKTVLRAILEHHERVDGSGYPRGETGDKLSWLGKLCGVVDSFLAMVMQKHEHAGMSHEKALKNLYSEITLYDPNIVYALEKIIIK